MKDIKKIQFIPGIAWFFVVLVLVCLPGKDVPSIDWLSKISFDKFVHTGIFAVMGLLFMLPIALSSFDRKMKFHYFIRIAISVSIWGLMTEFIQRFWIPGRSFDLLDWAGDSLGALVAFIFCYTKYIRSPKPV